MARILASRPLGGPQGPRPEPLGEPHEVDALALRRESHLAEVGHHRLYVALVLGDDPLHIGLIDLDLLVALLVIHL